MPGITLPAVASAVAVLLTGTIVLAGHDLGHVSMHMAVHIASMSVAAPLMAAMAILRWPPQGVRSSWLWIATLAQIVLLWTWHSPAVHGLGAGSPLLAATLHAALFLAAVSFWFAISGVASAARWQAIPALLLTGKLACLLAALLIFAPRTLYDSAEQLVHATGHLSALDDQHLAGILMIAACPMSYLVAAVIVTVQLIGRNRISQAALANCNLPAGP